MKLQIIQENLQKAISLAARFASPRAQLPILGNILIKTDKTKVQFASTNLETSVSIKVGAKIEKEGEVAIPAKIISEIVGNLPKENVELEVEKEQMKISSSSFSSSVLGMNSADFPKIPGILGKGDLIDLEFESVSDSLSKILFAVSTDETRPVLTGVLFVFEKNKLTLVATDGFRLSVQKINLKSEGKSKKIILPKSILMEIFRMEGEDEIIKTEVDEKEKRVIFGAGDTVYSSRLIEGEFPDYEKIIPKSANIKISVDKEDFLRAVKLAGIFARDNSNIVKIKTLKDSIKLLAQSSATGNQETKIEAKVEGGEKDFEISFNYRFVEDFIGSVKGEEIRMEFTTQDKAGVFLDPSNENYLHLIMPVRVQG